MAQVGQKRGVLLRKRGAADGAEAGPSPGGDNGVCKKRRAARAGVQEDVGRAAAAAASAAEAARRAGAAGTVGPSWFELMYSGAMSEEYKTYMAEEWGHEKRGDAALFEKLSLEGAQASPRAQAHARARCAARGAEPQPQSEHEKRRQSTARLTPANVCGAGGAELGHHSR